MRRYHILITCFDVSADHHAARLIHYLQHIWQDRVVWSIMGGEETLKLAQKYNHVHVLEHSATNSAIGLSESVLEVFRSPLLSTSVRRFLKHGYHKNARTDWGKVDLFLPFDGQGRNLSLGKFAYQLKIRTGYFFPPIVFIWGKWNIKKMRYFNPILCVFKPNWMLYRDHHVDAATFVGHPFAYYLLANDTNALAQKHSLPLTEASPSSHTSSPLHHLPQHQAPAKNNHPNQNRSIEAFNHLIAQYNIEERTEQFKKKLRIRANEWVISLFPGSRRQEIRKVTPILLKTLQTLQNTYPHGVELPSHTGKPKRYRLRFILALSHKQFLRPLLKLRMQANIDKRTLPIVYGAYEETLKVSRMALTCSGTVTFKASFLGVPHVILYNISWLSYLVAKIVVKTPYIGMLNILHNRLLVRELINHDLSVKNIIAEITPYLEDENYFKEQSRKLITSAKMVCPPTSITSHPFKNIETALAKVISSSSSS
ncbi:lipid-A-disaccharide synthase [Spirochaetota bacterium]|nr:lipid-A-disaccharide synthase [Spirochaetota bacterium]